MYELREVKSLWDLEAGFGDYKQDYRAAQLLTVIANIFRNQKKTRAFKIDDFLLRPTDKNTRLGNSKRIKATLDMMAGIPWPGKKRKRKNGKKK